MKRYFVTAICVLVAYLAILGPFTQVMKEKVTAIKLGISPPPKVLQVLFPDYQEFLAASSLGRIIQYYGAIVDPAADSGKVLRVADYPAMSRAVHAALHLDPYNMDGYYFGQSILVWDAKQYQLATELLEYGMQYRTWDWQLPFFAAFNQAYFLKDRAAAARLYMRAGELSGENLFGSLAGRYLQEVGETQMAVNYLENLAKSARTPAIKETLQVRITAFQIVLTVEAARDRYAEKEGHPPADIVALVTKGYLSAKPIDPYGGEFYLDEDKQVRTTSNFSFAVPRRSEVNDSSSSPSDK
ncbi:MAG: hypothetical protein U1D97_06320 [Desulfuromonadales bacterium]|nr:hypothetical protein [Desulfuromonadales bacterium]